MAGIDITNPAVGATFASIAAYLKEDYTVHTITEQINREAVLFGQLRRNSRDVRGEYAVIPLLKTGARNAVGSRDETDDLPTPGRQGVVEARLAMRYNTGRLTLTEKSIQASLNTDGAFEQAIEVETRGLVADSANDLSRQIFTGGTVTADAFANGKLFRSRGTASPLAIDFPGGSRAYPDLADPFGAKYLQVGDIIKFYSSAGVARDTSVVITAIDTTVTPNVITYTGTVTSLAVGDFGYKASQTGLSVANDDNFGSDMEGLRTIVDDGSTYLNQAADGTWSGFVRDFTLAPTDLTEKLMNQAFFQVERRSQKPPNLLVTTFSIRNFYAENLAQDKRFIDTTNLKGGYTGITFNGKPFLADKDCPPGHLYFLNTDDLYIYNQGGFYWFDRDAFWSRIPNKMAWEATLLYFANLGTPRRNRHSVIRGLNEPNAII